ncbi:MAG: hypothetical protein V1813_00905 [Candidatus Aenigmatarchaeota archaeon]
MADAAKLVEGGLKEGKILLLSVGSKDYREAMKSVVEFSARKIGRVCYVTLNDPYESITQKLGEAAENILFIDCVTSTIKPPAPKKGVMFVSSPRAFTEISLAVKKAIKEEKVDLVVLDSISALMVYEKSVGVLKFIHSLILTCREGNMSIIFVILKEDVDVSMLKDLTMFVDKVVELA